MLPQENGVKFVFQMLPQWNGFQVLPQGKWVICVSNVTSRKWGKFCVSNVTSKKWGKICVSHVNDPFTE